MPAVHINTDAQRPFVAAKWKNEIHDFCRQIQADIRHVLSAVDEGGDISESTTESQIERATIATTPPLEIAPPTKTTPPIEHSDVHDLMDSTEDSTEDRLRKLREQLNNLIDDEDA